MNRKQFLHIMLFLCVSMLLSRCAANTAQNQMQFGLKAAKEDLWDEAVFRWKKVVTADPNSSAAHNNLAVAYERRGLWEEAEKEYQIAVRLSPRNEYIQANYEKFKSRRDSQKEDEKEKEDEKKKR